MIQLNADSDDYTVLVGINSVHTSRDGTAAPQLPIGVWIQFTLVLKHKTCSIYYDKGLVARAKLGGRMIANNGNLHIGAYPIRGGVAGSGFDNF